MTRLESPPPLEMTPLKVEKLYRWKADIIGEAEMAPCLHMHKQ